MGKVLPFGAASILASETTSFKFAMPWPCAFFAAMYSGLCAGKWSRAVAVGHKPQAVSPMGRIDGTSRDNGRPAGVTDTFQVRMHSVEPILPNRCRNLFSHDDIGPAGTDEIEEDGPEMAFVCLRPALAGDAEGLAGA